MEFLQVIGERQVTHFQNTNCAVIVTGRQHNACVAFCRTERNVDNACVDACDCAQNDVSVTQSDTFIQNTSGFCLDDFFFVFKTAADGNLVNQHIGQLFGAAQTLSVCFFGRNACCLVRGFYDNFGCFCQSCTSCTPGNNAERFCFVSREAAHPLMENGGDVNVGVAEFCHVFFGQFVQGADCRNVLNLVTQLAVAYGDIFNALFCCCQSFDNCNCVGDTWRNQCAGQRTVRLTVDCNARFFIDTGQAVNVLPISHGLFNRNIFSVWNVIGNTAAFIGGKAACVSDFGQQSCVRCAVSYLKRSVQSFNNLAAAVYAVVYSREAVEERAVVAVSHSFFFTADTFCAVFILILTGIGVDCGRQQVCAAFVLKVLKQLDVIFNQTNACAGLYQSNALFFCLIELVRENFMFRQGFLISDCFVQVYFFSGFPGSQDFFTNFIKFVVGPFFIFNINEFHLSLTPFS